MAIYKITLGISSDGKLIAKYRGRTYDISEELLEAYNKYQKHWGKEVSIRINKKFKIRLIKEIRDETN